MSYERDIIDTVRDPLLVLDANLTVTSASRCFYTHFSTTPERTIGRKIYDLGNRDGGAGEGDGKGGGEWDIPALRTLLEEILPKEAHFDDFAVEHTFPPPIGHRSMILNARRITGTATGSGAGQSRGVILLAIEDITQRRAAETLAKVNQVALEVTLRSMGDGVIATDNQCRVTYLNPVAEKLTGWSFAEATQGSTGIAGRVGGRPMADIFNIVNEETRHAVESPVVKSLRLGSIVGLVKHTVLVRRDGTEIYIDDSAAPIELQSLASSEPNAKGEVVGVVMVFRDISERREIERKIEASEIRYRRLFESAHDGILLVDPKTRKITDANPYMEALLDIPVAELIGKELFEIGLLKDQEESRQAFQRLLTAGQIRYENLPLETRKGRQRDVEFVSNLYQEGPDTVIQCNIRDISERVRYATEREQILVRERASHELADVANRSKDIFMGTLAHELRTPLNAILGWAIMLRARVGSEIKPTDADIDHGLAVIERNARAQGKLIEDVLDVARLVSGKFELDRRPCDLAIIAFTAADAVRAAAQAKGITVKTIIDPATSLESFALSCDAARVSQAILNLLNNAVKFTPKDGNVTLRLERAGEKARVIVSDSGVGISPELLPYIFERFKQAEDGSTRMFGGLGLGLTIVWHIAELHGGKASASSAGEGQGATFTLELQVTATSAPSDEKVISTAAGDTVRLNDLRVLVVDDEEDARNIARLTLESAGAIVSTAASAREGFNAAARGGTGGVSPPPHILVSDLGMPGEDGCSLVRRLRADGITAHHLPAIALTAFASPQDRRRTLLAGFQVHMAKPVDPYDLIAVVGSLAGRTEV